MDDVLHSGAVWHRAVVGACILAAFGCEKRVRAVSLRHKASHLWQYGDGGHVHHIDDVAHDGAQACRAWLYRSLRRPCDATCFGH